MTFKIYSSLVKDLSSSPPASVILSQRFLEKNRKRVVYNKTIEVWVKKRVKFFSVSMGVRKK